MTTVLDKNVVKEALRDLIREEPAIFKSIIREVLTEDGPGQDEESIKARRQRLEEIVKEDFDEYGEVFKALA